MIPPDYITHYYERDYGPFLNMCDLDETEVQDLANREKGAIVGYNRFDLGEDFIRWRREADDLLIQTYIEKFGFTPNGRPYFALLGTFERTCGLYRNPEKLEMAVSDFEEHELTFMYPDHAHLIGYYQSKAPSLFYDLPKNWREQEYWGKLFTYPELIANLDKMQIPERIQKHKNADGWAGCYVEAHIWRREVRTNWERQNDGTGA
ncbi:MAG: hypothetical protein AAFX93_15620 [Verrucomicrobiota bacterium]